MDAHAPPLGELQGHHGLEIVISTLGREGQEAACTLLNEMLLPTTNSPDARM